MEVALLARLGHHRRAVRGHEALQGERILPCAVLVPAGIKGFFLARPRPAEAIEAIEIIPV